jgi:glycosyltransferase involved in cell wall biosynthesis
MKTSLCITTFNEEKNIRELIDSLLTQSKKADEIIIVDAGSTDNTQKIIKSYSNVRLIISKGVSIAKGRNLAIKNSRYEIIVMTDAGCIADKFWLENITEQFIDKKTDVVAGFYEMTGESNFQNALKPFLGIMPSNFKNNFLPATRSIAFRKKVWEKVCGFDEKFDRAGEDTDFNLKILKNNFIIARNKKATVKWEVPDNLIDAAKKFYFYAKGDAQSKNFLTSHNIKVISIFMRYIIFGLLITFSFISPIFVVFFAFIFTLYLIWSIYKMRKLIKEWQVRKYIVIIQLVSDLSVMLGFLAGGWDILNK